MALTAFVIQFSSQFHSFLIKDFHTMLYLFIIHFMLTDYSPQFKGASSVCSSLASSMARNFPLASALAWNTLVPLAWFTAPWAQHPVPLSVCTRYFFCSETGCSAHSRPLSQPHSTWLFPYISKGKSCQTPRVSWIPMPVSQAECSYTGSHIATHIVVFSILNV